jgi:hypothetical protein
MVACEEERMIFVGDWGDHHDVCVMDTRGTVLGRRLAGDIVAGIGEHHALIAENAEGFARGWLPGCHV